MTLAELEAWEERRDTLLIKYKSASREERKDMRSRLNNLNKQVQYYTTVVNDMKVNMKPTNVPDLLVALIGYKIRDL